MAAGLLAVLMVVTVAVSHAGAAVVARHRAQSAADLAALAGALHVAGGQAAACAVADSVVTAMRAHGTGCVVQGLDVTVSVSIPVRLGRWGTGQATANARAGPV